MHFVSTVTGGELSSSTRSGSFFTGEDKIGVLKSGVCREFDHVGSLKSSSVFESPSHSDLKRNMEAFPPPAARAEPYCPSIM